MKVLKQGQLPGDKKYRATCMNCKSEIEFQRKEAEWVADQREGDFLRVSCPVCQQRIHVSV